MSTEYYDPSALLSKKDIDGRAPIIYITVTNRTGGKTFAFSRLFLRRCLKDHKPRALLIRWNQDLKARAVSFGADVMQKDKAMEGHALTVESISNGKSKMGKLAQIIMLDDIPAIYVLALHDSDKIRENSALFQQITEIFFDEFQPETGGYVPDEVKRLQSIHTSIARGGESHVRHVPIYMASNAVSKINPYFIAMGIHKKPLGKQEFIAGKRWVLQQCVIDSAAREVQAEGIGAAFLSDSYTAMAAQNEYLLDDSRFIIKQPITGKQLAILESETSMCGVWQQKDGNIYISQKYDPSGRLRIAAERCIQSPINISADYIFSSELRKLYDRSLVRFDGPDSYACFMSMYNNLI